MRVFVCSIPRTRLSLDPTITLGKSCSAQLGAPWLKTTRTWKAYAEKQTSSVVEAVAAAEADAVANAIADAIATTKNVKKRNMPMLPSAFKG